jgi:hypothetical protein
MRATEDVLARFDEIMTGESRQDEWQRYDAMADLLRSLAPNVREGVVTALRRWIKDRGHPTHSTTAVSIAGTLSDSDLVDEAVAEAMEREIKDEPFETAALPNWYLYHAHVMNAVTRVPTAAGLKYLAHLKSMASSAVSRSRRKLAISAWIRLCHISGGALERSCLREAFAAVRRWDDDRLSRTAEGLAIGLYVAQKRTDVLQEVLTPSELSRVMRFAH